MTIATRRGLGRAYVPTHAGGSIPPLSTYSLRSCGRCGVHVANKGGAKHRVFGWIGECCAKGKSS